LHIRVVSRPECVLEGFSNVIGTTVLREDEANRPQSEQGEDDKRQKRDHQESHQGSD
jgi:hypothetical protein